jgi:hypothetical protein
MAGTPLQVSIPAASLGDPQVRRTILFLFDLQAQPIEYLLTTQPTRTTAGVDAQADVVYPRARFRARGRVISGLYPQFCFDVHRRTRPRSVR